MVTFTLTNPLKDRCREQINASVDLKALRLSDKDGHRLFCGADTDPSSSYSSTPPTAGAPPNSSGRSEHRRAAELTSRRSAARQRRRRLTAKRRIHVAAAISPI